MAHKMLEQDESSVEVVRCPVPSESAVAADVEI